MCSIFACDVAMVRLWRFCGGLMGRGGVHCSWFMRARGRRVVRPALYMKSRVSVRRDHR